MADALQLTDEERAGLDAINRRIGEAFFGRMPAYRYFQKKGGPMFCWTTAKEEGEKYASFVYRPTGKGARSGQATRFQLVESGSWKIVEHAKRKDAKARALRLYRKHVEKAGE